MRFNFRGVGGSGGAWDGGRARSTTRSPSSAPSATRRCRSRSPAYSFGGYVASHAAERLAGAVERIVLVAPAVLMFPVARTPQDSIVIHGESDSVVPLAAVLDWARPVPQPVVVVPGAGHFFHGQLGLLKQLVVGAWHR